MEETEIRTKDFFLAGALYISEGALPRFELSGSTITMIFQKTHTLEECLRLWRQSILQVNCRAFAEAVRDVKAAAFRSTERQ